ncbi:MAG: YfhO family protein [Chlamydiota bacterium]
MNESSCGGNRWSSRDACCIGLFCIIAALVFRGGLDPRAPVVIAHHAQNDITQQFYPWRVFAFGLLKKGIIPLWNPYQMCGYPFVASWQSAVFYPPNLVFLVLPAWRAINYSFASHILLAGVGTYLFMRIVSGSRFAALVSGLSFMLSSTLILRVFAGHLSLVCAIPWFPAGLIAAEGWLRTRRGIWAVAGGAAFAMQILAGHPQTAYYSAVSIALYLAIRGLYAPRGGRASALLRGCVFGAVAAVLGASLAAVQLLPGIELVRHSARGASAGAANAGLASFAPENLLTCVMPDAFGDFVSVFCWGRHYLWDEAVYIGILPLALALIALLCARSRCVYGAASLAMATFLIAMGPHTPLAGPWIRFIPGFALLGGPTKILFVTVFALCCMAGMGGRYVVGGMARRKYCRAAAWGVLASVALLVTLACALDMRNGESDSAAWRALVSYRKHVDPAYWRVLDDPAFLKEAYPVFRGAARRLCLFLALSALAFLYAARERKNMRCAQAVVLGVLVVDLWSYDARFITTMPVAACRWPRAVARFFSRDRTAYRVLRDIRVAVPGVNQNMIDGISSCEGYEPDSVVLIKEFSSSSGVSSEHAAAAMSRPESAKMASMMNVKYLIFPAAVSPPSPDLVLRYEDAGARIYENSGVQPRAWVVHQAMVAPVEGQDLALMRWAGFDPRRQAVLDRDPGINLAGGGGPSKAVITRDEPCEVVAQCRLDTPGILVLSDTYYPGWRVTVDGKEGPILRANHAFRGVPLGRGAHEVRFTYEPASFRFGAMLSVLTAIVCAIFCIAAVARKAHADHRL